MEKVILVLVDKIVNPIIAVMFGFAIIVFLWGIFRFVSSEEHKEDGKRSMMWGMVGFFIMVSAYGIIAFIRSSLGL